MIANLLKFNFPFALGMVASVLSTSVDAISINSTDWDYPSVSFTPVIQAGAYFSASFESTSSAATLSVTSAPNTAVTSNSECGETDPAWKVSAELINAPSGLTIKVKRTNSGVGGTLAGGASYNTLSAVPSTLWCGWGDVSNISLQYQVDSLGVEDGYGLKTWNVRYTVETL